MMAFSTIRILETRGGKKQHKSSLCFCGLLEGAVGFVDLVISGLLRLGQLESLKVVEGGSCPEDGGGNGGLGEEMVNWRWKW